MKTPTSIVKRAGSAFNQGDYRTAKQLYQQAADRYGKRLFDINLALCDKRMNKEHPTVVKAQHISASPNDSLQLEQTQQLLEHYYNRCQELEYRILDKH